MTQEEIAEALEIPWPKLREFAKDDDLLLNILNIALSKGFQLGSFDISRNYNKAFKGYTLETIHN